MRRFTQSFLIPYIAASGYRRLCEVGAQGGGNIDRLLQMNGVAISIVDPCIDSDLDAKYAGNPRVAVKKGRSLEMLPVLGEQYDCLMIDGDHNWYTVYLELKIIHEKNLLAKDGTIFLHDVCWPYARRDMYYDLETVPAEFRHPVAKRGILLGVSALSDDPAAGKNGNHWNALYEGGARNGVLTAIEDFLREHPDTYSFFPVEKEWGLGVIVRKGENEPTVSRLQFKASMHNGWERIKKGIKRLTGRIEYLPPRR